MKRIEAIVAVAAASEEALIICNIGFPSRELYAISDRPENFYMLGSMGLASSIGLGMAIAQPNRRIIVLDGDGSVLMNLGTLATIAHHAPKNYHLIILDNCCYGSAGSQPTCTSERTDLYKMARAAGVEQVRTVTTPVDLVNALSDQCVIVARVDSGNAEVPIIDISPEQILARFRRSFMPSETPLS